MHLTHIDLDKLSIAAVNMRHQRRPPEIADILPSIRARGILVPLLVRPAAIAADQPQDGRYEIVAGRRRYFAARALAQDAGYMPALPCAVMEPGDDAAALEASLIENLARHDADEMTQYEAFVKLVREGRSVAAIAATFGLTEAAVKQRLALGNLLPKIREAYRRAEIEPETVRHLTLASKAQQKQWLTLFEDPEAYAPQGAQVKHWLFGGTSISVTAALFPLEDYHDTIVADLFGEDGYFADTELFWSLQNTAIAARREAYLKAGWPDVVVLEPGQPFHLWEHEKTPKRKGGKVYVHVAPGGNVTCHEGYLTRQEAQKVRRKAAGRDAEVGAARPRPARPEVSAALQTYIDLHRHAAVRAALLERPDIALRLAVAHMIGGSPLWRVMPEPQRAGRDDIAGSIAACPAEAAYRARRADIRSRLGMDAEDAPLVAGDGDPATTAALFATLLALPDDEVLQVLTLAMAETLAAGTALTEAAGVQLRIDMASVWQPDEAFFALLRDKPVIHAMLAEVAGPAVVQGNQAATGAVQKQIIRDCLSGSNGRDKVAGWLPGWFAFPVRPYTEDGGFRTAADWAVVSSHFPVA